MIVLASSLEGFGIGQTVVPQTIAMCSSSASRSDDLISLRGSPQYSGDGSAGDCNSLLRRLICTFDGKARAGAGQGIFLMPRPDARFPISHQKGGRKVAHHDLSLSVEAARAVIAAPQMHTVEGLRRSIEVLLTYGDWIDVERAKMLEVQLDIEELRPTAREVFLDGLGSVALFALVVAGFWIGAGFGVQ